MARPPRVLDVANPRQVYRTWNMSPGANFHQVFLLVRFSNCTSITSNSSLSPPQLLTGSRWMWWPSRYPPAKWTPFREYQFQWQALLRWNIISQQRGALRCCWPVTIYIFHFSTHLCQCISWTPSLLFLTWQQQRIQLANNGSPNCGTTNAKYQVEIRLLKRM